MDWPEERCHQRDYQFGPSRDLDGYGAEFPIACVGLARSVRGVRDAGPKWLPWLFLAVFALSRWPGVLPPSFSAAYALMFCAGVLFPGRLAWVGPMGVLFLTDLALNLYYQFARGYDVFSAGMLVFLAGNYAGYLLLIGLGRVGRHLGAQLLEQGRRWRALAQLIGGGAFGAVLFYLLTNTAAWWLNPFRNPEYVRTLAGWWWALTKGTAGYPETWTFLWNSLLSGGLFTALFAGTWSLTASESPREKGEEISVPPETEEAQA
jgi:hypothetical protein